MTQSPDKKFHSEKVQLLMIQYLIAEVCHTVSAIYNRVMRSTILTLLDVGNKGCTQVGDRVREFTWNLGTLLEGYEIYRPPLALPSFAHSKTILIEKTGVYVGYTIDPI